MTLAAVADSSFRISEENLRSSTSANINDQKLWEFTHIPQDWLIALEGSDYTLQVHATRTEEGYWVATSDEFSTYGDGETGENAVIDYLQVLREYYDGLVEEEGILSLFLKQELEKLRLFFQ